MSNRDGEQGGAFNMGIASILLVIFSLVLMAKYESLIPAVPFLLLAFGLAYIAADISR